MNSSYNVGPSNLDGSPTKRKDSKEPGDFASTSFTQDISNAYKGTKGFILKAVGGGGKSNTTTDKVGSN